MKFLCVAFMISAAAVAPLQAATPTWDNSGNKLLSGTYYFRQVIWDFVDSSPDAYALYGNVSFDGNGNYTMSSGSVSLLDVGQGTIEAYGATGTYSISASGFGFITHPLISGAVIYGAVANGVFIASSTETGYNDLFMAAPVGSPIQNNSTFNGTYQWSYADPVDSLSAEGPLTANGAGNLGTVSLRGYNLSNGSSIIGQQNNGITYSFVNGAGKVAFPSCSPPSPPLMCGNEYFYFSPDGSFFFGGAPDWVDFFVGVQTSGSTSNLNSSGTYYQVGTDFTDSTFDTFYGSFNTTVLSGTGVTIEHQRLLLLGAAPYGATFSGSFPTSGSTYTGAQDYTVGAGGNVRIGFGEYPYLGMSVSILAPPFSGPSVYINPTQILNASSFAPFTAGISPGELLFIQGTGLAPSGSFTIAPGGQLPTTLNNVQVLIDGIQAPIYYVADKYLTAVVPYAASTFPYATIQVNNNGVLSNQVSVLVNQTSPGVSTNPATGIGYAIAQDVSNNYQLVTPQVPAQVGDNVVVYLTGLGAVFPPIQDGAVGPSNPTSTTTNTIGVNINSLDGTVSQAATVLYAGLAPGSPAQYALIITIPSGVQSGDNLLEVYGPDSDTQLALISIGGSGTVVSAAIGEQEKRQAQRAGQHGKASVRKDGIVKNTEELQRRRGQIQ